MPSGQAGLNCLFRNYKKSARRRNLVFLLELAEFQAITSDRCAYCNKAPTQIARTYGSGLTKSGVKRSEYLYNGIDRLDSDVGYVAPNCVSCCGDCNALKSNRSLKNFIEQVSAIYQHFVAKKRD